ncbi:hypothetical protein HP532_15630 [Pseudomonas sp. CrR25]|nr:hypothetical protein [Pseudomonas sp. CrR25]
MKVIFTAIALMVLPAFAYAKELYRAPSSGDSGTYFLLTHEKIENGIIKVTTSRIGKSNEYTDFTELKINCYSKQYLELAGSSEDGAQEKPSKQLKDWSSKSKWTPLVTGSSKYDLVQFVCKK